MPPAAYEDYFRQYAGAKDLKVEIGGGAKPHGQGFLDVDRLDAADVVLDLEMLDVAPLPFPDDSVAELYTSHCLEHIHNLRPLMREIMRICKIGALVEIRVPFWTSNMAMCYDHKHVIGPDQIVHWTAGGHNTDFWWQGIPKTLCLNHTEHVPCPAFKRWQRLLPQASKADILELCPDACQEVRWKLTVVGV